MLQRRIEHLINVLSGREFFQRNKYNSRQLWKRACVFAPWYIIGLIFAVLDLFFIGYLIQVTMQITQRNGRKLTLEEIKLFSELPMEKRYLESVMVYEKSWVARFGAWMIRKKQLGLGLANTIHFSREIDIENGPDCRWFVHEIAHTLQFKYRGLIYIPEALIAQQFSGYTFGGLETLKHANKLRAFNPEQQADMFVIIQLSKFESEIRQEIEKGNW
ncbi:MAG: hypothetical protein HRT58_16130 [Crocinitomicaceae bacterium]|nr:hypothetical protein [Flavobacteriales bacterium]NQZ37198.1 hypothetical protein [Crocinitomicaceae bacterium]